MKLGLKALLCVTIYSGYAFSLANDRPYDKVMINCTLVNGPLTATLVAAYVGGGLVLPYAFPAHGMWLATGDRGIYARDSSNVQSPEEACPELHRLCI
jgi:hypothetical protein